MDKNSVYLTFDDGPTPVLTHWILEFLAKENIKGTFFCVGDNIKKYPEQFLSLKENGHRVGNHTMAHQNAAKTKWRSYKTSVAECEALIGNDLFRPPYGRLSAWKSARLAKKYKIIMWSWLSYDYDANVPVKDILESAKKDIQAGNILVLHDNDKVKERLKEILPELVAIIREKGLTFAVIPN